MNEPSQEDKLRVAEIYTFQLKYDIRDRIWVGRVMSDQYGYVTGHGSTPAEAVQMVIDNLYDESYGDWLSSPASIG